VKIIKIFGGVVKSMLFLYISEIDIKEVQICFSCNMIIATESTTKTFPILGHGHQ